MSDDDFPHLTASRGVGPVIIIGLVADVAVFEAHGIFQVKRRQDMIKLFIQDTVLFPFVRVYAVSQWAVHTIGDHIIVLDLPVRRAGLRHQPERIPHLHDIAEVAIAQVPRGLQPGLGLSRVEQRKGQAGHVSL